MRDRFGHFRRRDAGIERAGDIIFQFARLVAGDQDPLQ